MVQNKPNPSSPYTLHTLDNGLQVVIERMPDVKSVALGFLVRIGSRDEPAELAGVSHFLEHMMFKGTGRRTWRDITIDFDRMGSAYNAYTSSSRTVYYGWVRPEDLDAQLELLADMMTSQLPPDEFDMEKNVVLEEIAMSKDQLEHVALDFLQEKVFAGHPLAWPVLGHEKTVGALSRDQMHAYFAKHYQPANMFLVVAGNVDPAEVIALAERHCGTWKRGEPRPAREAPAIHEGVDRLRVDRFKQQIITLAFPAVGAMDPLAETASAAANILGGENSRMYWDICQTGLSPRAGAFHLDYPDRGLFVLWAACDPDRSEQLLEAMRAQTQRISTELVADHEVARVKNKRRTSLAVEGEAPYYRLTQLMDDMEHHGGPRTVEQMLAEVEAVSAESIRKYFEQHPINKEGHLASVGPREWP
jgi:predicted Zn-dependent peptidase